MWTTHTAIDNTIIVWVALKYADVMSSVCVWYVFLCQNHEGKKSKFSSNLEWFFYDLFIVLRVQWIRFKRKSFMKMKIIFPDSIIKMPLVFFLQTSLIRWKTLFNATNLSGIPICAFHLQLHRKMSIITVRREKKFKTVMFLLYEYVIG